MVLRLPSPSCLHGLPENDCPVGGGGLRDRPGLRMHLCSGSWVLVPRGRTSPQGDDIRITILLRVATADRHSFLSDSGKESSQCSLRGAPIWGYWVSMKTRLGAALGCLFRAQPGRWPEQRCTLKARVCLDFGQRKHKTARALWQDQRSQRLSTAGNSSPLSHGFWWLSAVITE